MHSPNIAVTLGMRVHVLERFLPDAQRPAFEALKASQAEETRRFEERRNRERPARLAKEHEMQADHVDRLLGPPWHPNTPPLDRGQLLARAFELAAARISRQDAGDRLRVTVRHLEQQLDLLTNAQRNRSVSKDTTKGRDFER